MRRNRRGKGSTHPAVLKLWRQKYLFAPNNRPSLSADYTLFHIAGLQESSPEEPRMHQNSWRPWTHLASLQRSQDRYPMGRGLTTSRSELHPSGFELAFTLQCWFRSDATDTSFTSMIVKIQLQCQFQTSVP